MESITYTDSYKLQHTMAYDVIEADEIIGHLNTSTSPAPGDLLKIPDREGDLMTVQVKSVFGTTITV